MVEVTRSNFEDVFPEVEKAVRNASFITLDAEFTGLDMGNNDSYSLFDSMNERYRKLRSRATSFTISQIGLSTFLKHPTENSYKVKTYIFYIRPYLCGSIDKRFVCQASCIDFLCRYDFDFNKFLKEGIPFINDDEEKKFIEELEDGSISYSYDLLEKQDSLVNDAFLGAIEQAKVDSNDEVDDESFERLTVPGKKLVFTKDKLYPEYFQLNQIRNKYPSLWASVDGDMITVEEVSPKRRKELQGTCHKEKEKVVNFFLGFTKVFRVLKEAKKPIVGHNSAMDLLLCFQNFHKPLPATYNSFKKELHSIFPSIYDTRHIWRHVRRYCKLKDIPKKCGLFELYEMFKKPPDSLATLYVPNISIPEGSKYADEAFPHEAGYDSYITGWVFLHICHVIAIKNVKSPLFIEAQTLKQHLNAVSPFENKINIARSRYGFIDLAGNDPPPIVPGMLYVCRKNGKLLNELELSRIFGRYGTLEIKMMKSGKGAIIVVGGIGIFKDILRDFKNHEELDVMKYNVFKHSYLNNVLWITVISSACVVAFLSVKLVIQSSR